jgi:hypothetical protein
MAGKLRAAAAAADHLVAERLARDATSFIEAGTNVNEKPLSQAPPIIQLLCRDLSGLRRRVPQSSQSFCLGSEDLLDRRFELGQLPKDVLLPKFDIREQL